jgi:uncharacterized lipoprotein YmbA
MGKAAAALIKTLWTLELSDALLAALAEQLTPVLEHWRVASQERGSADLRSPSKHFDTHADQETRVPYSTSATAFDFPVY